MTESSRPQPMPPSVRRGRGSSNGDGGSSQGGGAGVLAIKGRLVEWHAMTDKQRTAAWEGLVEWVAWLHDRYELSIQSRLPECWPQHPGIIEELWALKMWREALYTNDPEAGVLTGHEAGGLAQHARYWQTDLRNLFSQLTFYAERCAAEHGGGRRLVDRSKTDLKAQWLTADPTCGITAPVGSEAAVATSRAPRLAAPDMHRRLELGSARGLGGSDSDHVHSFGDWWTRDPEAGDWVKITDPEMHRRLDNLAAAGPDE
ncbi:hypothetical protein [Glycomyces sp. NPDC021274]|uniref:hypothetical protein n=1 Tax=Glycomyces sp. NPDC021274 TaxID=3155120 RepID=UPI0033D60722